MNNIASPRTDDAGIEQEIQLKGLTAARVTPKDIEDNIKSEHYFTAADGAKGANPVGLRTPVLPDTLNLLTFCVLILNNGFSVVGESTCASPENFDAEIGRKIAREDAEIGRKIARENAKQKIWPLMGYELRTKLTTK